MQLTLIRKVTQAMRMATWPIYMQGLQGLLHEVGDAERSDDKRDAFLAMMKVRHAWPGFQGQQEGGSKQQGCTHLTCQEVLATSQLCGTCGCTKAPHITSTSAWTYHP